MILDFLIYGFTLMLLLMLVLTTYLKLTGQIPPLVYRADMKQTPKS